MPDAGTPPPNEIPDQSRSEAIGNVGWIIGRTTNGGLIGAGIGGIIAATYSYFRKQSSINRSTLAKILIGSISLGGLFGFARSLFSTYSTTSEPTTEPRPIANNLSQIEQGTQTSDHVNRLHQERQKKTDIRMP